MAGKSTPESIKQIHYLAATLKAPRITENAQRLPTRPATPAGPTRTTSLPC